MIVVFAGPTINPAQHAPHLKCAHLPPVQHGDILTALQLKPDAIAIIDGYFEGAASVWHKEILYALDQNVPVYGCSSMGALRAAELNPFGMVGVGQIFEWYRDGVVEDDDEVAVLHGPAEANYLTISEPMVNIRATLALAQAQGIIDSAYCQALISTAKSTFYKQRSWEHLLTGQRQQSSDGKTDETLIAWIKSNRIDLKKQDALQLFHHLHARFQDSSQQKTGDSPARHIPFADFHFEWTNVWDRAYQLYGPANDTGAGKERHILDELRLDPDTYTRYKRQALLHHLARNPATTQPTAAEVKSALRQFKADNRLSTRKEIGSYMENCGLDESSLTQLLEDAARVTQLQQSTTGLQTGIVNQLKLDGRYTALHQSVCEKQTMLSAAGNIADPPPPQVLAWYFTHKLGTPIPRPLGSHLSKIDLPDSDDFYRLISEDYLYYCLRANNTG